MGSAVNPSVPRGAEARAGWGQRGRLGEQREAPPDRWESVFEGGVVKCVGEPGVWGAGEAGRLVRREQTSRVDEEDAGCLHFQQNVTGQ